MKIFFGTTLSVLGMITLILGLTRIYMLNSEGDISSEAAVGSILVLGGMVSNIIGANITKGETFGKIGNVTKVLYVVSFVTAIAVIIVGLFNVFSPQKMIMSIGLLIIGFVSAISSSSNAIADVHKIKE